MLDESKNKDEGSKIVAEAKKVAGSDERETVIVLIRIAKQYLTRLTIILLLKHEIV